MPKRSQFLQLLTICLITLVHVEAAEKTPAEIVALEAHVIKDPKLIIDYQLSSLDRLIQMSERTKANLDTLRNQIIDYRAKQESYLKQPDDKELLFQMAKSANAIVNQAKAAHLNDTLEPEFLEEIIMLAQIYRKITLPKIP